MSKYRLFQDHFNLANGFQIWLCDIKGNRLSLVFATVNRRLAYSKLDSLNA